MPLYRVEVAQTVIGFVEVEQDPAETLERLRQRAKEMVEEGSLTPRYTDDSTISILRSYDAEASCLLERGSDPPYCSVHDSPMKGVDLCWQRADDMSQREEASGQTWMWGTEWWKRS